MACRICGAPLEGGGTGVCVDCASTAKMNNSVSRMAGCLVPLAIIAGLLLIASAFFNAFFTSLVSFDTIGRFGFDFYKSNLIHFHSDDYIRLNEGVTVDCFRERPDAVREKSPDFTLEGGTVFKHEGFLPREGGSTWLAASAYKGEEPLDFFIYLPEKLEPGQNFHSDYIDVYAGKELVKEQQTKCLESLMERNLLLTAQTREAVKAYGEDDSLYKISITGGNYRDIIAGIMRSFNRGATVYFAEKENKKEIEQIIDHYMNEKNMDRDIAQLNPSYSR